MAAYEQSTVFPQVVVLDLDGTVWTPEMYELWSSGGAPFEQASWDALRDRGKTTVKLYDGVAVCIKEATTHSAILSVASTTDEPSWARECLAKFKTEGGPLAKALEHVFVCPQIYKAPSKKVHLKAIRDHVGCEYSDMLFIDNESYNIRSVAPLGVKSFLVPDGLTVAAWTEALQFFRSGSSHRPLRS